MRLDQYLVEKLSVSSRTKAQDLIEGNFVTVNGKIQDSCHYEVKEKDVVKIAEHDQYVSRGAYKLIEALNHFKIDFKEQVIVDVGASTGGWTQVALANGAKKVYAVDVGSNQLDSSLVKDKRVAVYDNTNLKDLTIEMFSDHIDYVIADVSFISLTFLLERLSKIFTNKLGLILLIKPQYEVPPEIAKESKGVITSKKWQKYAIDKISEKAHGLEYKVQGVIPSPIKGREGNQEYLMYLEKDNALYFSYWR